MTNLRMQEKLDANECIDVRTIGREIEPGLFLLHEFIEGVDYADTQTERWIWSIGQHKKSREIVASTDTCFYQNPEYECLWLR